MKGKRHFVGLLLVPLLFAACQADVPRDATAPPGHEPVVHELQQLLDAEPELKSAVEAAIEAAALDDIQDLHAFLDYLDQVVTLIPYERDIVPRALKFYYIINQAPDDRLNQDERFNAWMANTFVPASSRSSWSSRLMTSLPTSATPPPPVAASKCAAMRSGGRR